MSDMFAKSPPRRQELDDARAPRRECTEDRRAAIARAARALIAEKGFEGLRTRDIAARVGINIATLHYHVPSKEELIGLVAQNMQSEFKAQNQAHPRDGMTPREMWHQEAEDFIDTIENRKELLIVFSEFFDRSRRDPVVAGILLSMQRYWHGMIRDILSAGIADGSFRADVDADAAAALCISTFVGIGRLLPDIEIDHRAVINELEKSFLTPSI